MTEITPEGQEAITELEIVVESLKAGRIAGIAYCYVNTDSGGQDYCVCTPQTRSLVISRLVSLTNALVQNQLKDEGYGRTTH